MWHQISCFLGVVWDFCNLLFWDVKISPCLLELGQFTSVLTSFFIGNEICVCNFVVMNFYII